ncbi:MAG TPA: NADH-quinone oxidoreductase subunit M [Cyanobacteria bacterium UBA11149]|nr:NADH-quinone oxidoreductase subunit M [Cyanobacteria bacterium UBA11367]HBE60394.1 NADH-quinone oxidoreductase subunit M [Cyanobacteria bacterium UBA11366]HBK66331.1 NADH-quinone oxidoreductase subunit M [Cyanobacteria bacterium UBA11166]HBR73796.1 NADH-quinone oxidoreductase subunit M [Cyanobacteria bacterium UBA11159]HBS71369.1 NADH-quinone oxidoreductase subunit M [Cyanobacteria bacterium UBA11153]HBW89971.1 NADH-quinone oxidoreductase subunit M [Cyanobacteria bacterium UBA11149]HCA9709
MLSTLIGLPLIGAAIIGLFPGNISSAQLRYIALAFASAILLVTIWLATQFDLSNSGLQFQEYLPWIPQIGLSYKLATDGLSFPLVALGSLLTGIIIFSARINVERLRLKYAMIFLVNAGVVGALLAQNLLLFIIFYELILIPLYLLIAIWGGEKREYAAMKFLIYTAVSGILILAGFLGMTWLSHSNSFDYDRIATQDLSLVTQLILLTILVIGFGIKIPLVPLHTWLPDAYVEASPAVAILLGGMVAKLGTYGLIRFGLQLFPETWALVAPGLSIIGVVSVMYGALTAIAQKDIKRMVAYSSIGHMGYIVVAAAALTPLGLLGAVAQMVSHGLILAILFYLVGIIEAKVGTRDLDILNGLMNPLRGLPLTSAMLILGGMASAGIPFLVGFIAEFLVFQGSYSVFPIQTLLCIFASGLTAVYFVILLNRTCFGKLDNNTSYYPQVTWNEQAPALFLAILIIFLGIQPTWLVRWTEPTTDAIVATITTHTNQQIALNYYPQNTP